MKRFFVILALLLPALFSTAQVLDSMIAVYADEYPDQKIHVHFDKDVYRAGETMWFKAYLMSGFTPATNSSNYYTELVNDKGVVLQRKVYPILEASAHGSFDLPDSLPAGNLLCRAYTTWMLNFDTSFIFQKSIAVLDKNGKTAAPVSAVSRTTAIHFFPEGGNLVNTLTSVVAFKANDNYGMPVFAKGKVVNNKGAVVTTFAAAHDGMGSFMLTPQEGETYKAEWTDSAGNYQVTELPQASQQGYVLTITSLPGKKMFSLTRTENVLPQWLNVNVVALLGQQRVYKAKASLVDSRVTSGSIPVENFPSGVLQIAVFSENWEPIAERVVMINNHNFMFDAQVNTPVLSSNFRAKNTFEIAVEDTLLSNLSLSVTDATLGRQTGGDNIISRMLLTGDIRGYVHNPTYYFSNNSDSAQAYLDLVMLTHGWRRYNWSDLAKGRRPRLKYPLDNYLSLEATVFGVTTASPLRNDEELLIFLQQKDSTRQLLQMPKRGNDKFVAPNIIFYDTATVYYQFMRNRNAEKEMAVGFNNNFYKGVRSVSVSNRPVGIEVDSAIIARAQFMATKMSQLGGTFNQGNVLATVTVKTRVKSRLEELDDKYASGLFKGQDGFSFDLTEGNVNGAFNIFTYLQGKVPGLQINGIGSTTTLSWRGSNTALFLNEMNTDPSMLSGININDIAYIKVIRPPFMGAIGGGSGGAIAVYTKKGNDVKTEPGLGLPKTRVTGYASPKEFYSPDYKDLSASADVAADYRSTLYWNPVVLTDATRKKVTVNFYNNDVTKVFRVVLEGVNEIGKLVHIEKVLQPN